MQMLCTDKVYKERRRCQELNAIEADSLTEQILKRLIFKHVIKADSLSQTDRQHHCDDLHLNLVQVLVLSLF